MELSKHFPLGESVYAYVKTRNGDTKIHIRHFVQATNTKGGSVVPSVRGVKMDLKSFIRLCKMKKNIKTEYISANLKTDERRVGGGKMKKERKRLQNNNNNNNKNKNNNYTVDPSLLYQYRTDRLPAPEVFQHDPNCACFKVTALTPRYPLTSTNYAATNFNNGSGNNGGGGSGGELQYNARASASSSSSS